MLFLWSSTCSIPYSLLIHMSRYTFPHDSSIEIIFYMIKKEYTNVMRYMSYILFFYRMLHIAYILVITCLYHMLRIDDHMIDMLYLFDDTYMALSLHSFIFILMFFEILSSNAHSKSFKNLCTCWGGARVTHEYLHVCHHQKRVIVNPM